MSGTLPPVAGFLDGRELSASECARLSAHPDWKSGFFETMRLCKGEIPLWELHLDRLRTGFQMKGLEMPDLGYLHRLLAFYNDNDYRCRFTILPGEAGKVSQAVTLHVLPAVQDSYRLCTAPEPHPFEGADGTLVKWSARPFYDSMLSHAMAAGFDDALLYDQQGYASETCIANLLISGKDGALYTPSERTLPLSGVGIRHLKSVLNMRPETAITETLLTPHQLKDATAMWIVNALRGVQPITQLDQHLFSADDQITRYLSDLFPF